MKWFRSFLQARRDAKRLKLFIESDRRMFQKSHLAYV